jgi:hypothetical protein
MNCTMLVSSHGGMKTLTILGSPAIDIMVCMDWLKKYNGVIHCVKRVVQLTGAKRTKVEFVATPSTRTSVSLNTMKAIPMEEIRVVRDFPDVFREDLPGMPPNHDIEFIIDLVPGTAPISKR